MGLRCTQEWCVMFRRAWHIIGEGFGFSAQAITETADNGEISPKSAGIR